MQDYRFHAKQKVPLDPSGANFELKFELQLFIILLEFPQNVIVKLQGSRAKLGVNLTLVVANVVVVVLIVVAVHKGFVVVNKSLSDTH